MSKANQIQVAHTPVSSLIFILKAVILSYAVSVILLFATAIIAVMRSMSDSGISILVNIVTAISTTLAGFLSGRHFNGKGIFFGALSGIVYTLLLWISGNIISGDINLGFSFLTSIIIGLLCGAVGGICGINTKRKRRR